MLVLRACQSYIAFRYRNCLSEDPFLLAFTYNLALRPQFLRVQQRGGVPNSLLGTVAPQGNMVIVRMGGRRKDWSCLGSCHSRCTARVDVTWTGVIERKEGWRWT